METLLQSVVTAFSGGVLGVVFTEIFGFVRDARNRQMEWRRSQREKLERLVQNLSQMSAWVVKVHQCQSVEEFVEGADIPGGHEAVLHCYVHFPELAAEAEEYLKALIQWYDKKSRHTAISAATGKVVFLNLEPEEDRRHLAYRDKLYRAMREFSERL